MMLKQRNGIGLLVGALVFGVGVSGLMAGVAVSGELKQWHRVQLTFDGPDGFGGREKGDVNLFSDRRLDVVFTHGVSGARIVRPGYFAADGKAGESGARSAGFCRPERTAARAEDGTRP